METEDARRELASRIAAKIDKMFIKEKLEPTEIMSILTLQFIHYVEEFGFDEEEALGVLSNCVRTVSVSDLEVEGTLQ